MTENENVYFKFYWGPSEQLSESSKGEIPPLNADFPSSPSLGSRMSQGKNCSERVKCGSHSQPHSLASAETHTACCSLGPHQPRLSH